MISSNHHAPRRSAGTDQELLLLVHRLCTKAGLPYGFSHGTAMALHGLSAPCSDIYLIAARRLERRLRQPVVVHSVVYRGRPLFGLAPLFIDDEQVWISDLERTILDALKHPEYCGGFMTLLRGVADLYGALDLARLCDYALQLDIDSVVRRLGYLLELCGLDELVPSQVLALRERIGPGYHALDTSLARAGLRHHGWRLIINQDPEQLQRAAAPRRPRRPLLVRRTLPRRTRGKRPQVARE